MKSVILFILIGLVAFLGFSISGLRKELLSSKEYARQIVAFFKPVLSSLTMRCQFTSATSERADLR